MTITPLTREARLAFARYDKGLGRKIIDDMITEIERLTVVNAELLGAAREIQSAIAVRDLGAFIWGSYHAERLRTAIENAEGPAL